MGRRWQVQRVSSADTVTFSLLTHADPILRTEQSAQALDLTAACFLGFVSQIRYVSSAVGSRGMPKHAPLGETGLLNRGFEVFTLPLQLLDKVVREGRPEFSSLR